MKAILLFFAAVLSVAFSLQAQDSPDVLVGYWNLDMSPHIQDDDNFAMMEIKKIKDGKMTGTFYRRGVKLREGQINTQTDRIYGALISGDNSGEYNTSFYYENGKLFGTTHAVDRGFLAVWVATRQ